MRIFIIFISSTILLFACKSKTSIAENQHNETIDGKSIQAETKLDEEGLIIDDNEQVATHKNPNKKGYKTLHSLRYHFAIDIPDAWTGIDKSGNGDGFFISIPEVDCEISVYGETSEPAIIEMYNSMCDELVDFAFDNGFSGKKCRLKNEVTYSQSNDNIILSVYIKNITALDANQKISIEKMAETLRFFEKMELKS